MTGGMLLKLAKQSAEQYVRRREFILPPPTLSSDLLQQRACYVSIFENPGRNLCSTYGRVLPQCKCLAEEVIKNTIEAVKRRQTGTFRPIDLLYMSYSVAILGPLQRITTPTHLNPSQYGLYIRSDRDKTAIVLPQRTGIITATDQIATALRESGINTNQETFTMYRFAVIHHDG